MLVAIASAVLAGNAAAGQFVAYTGETVTVVVPAGQEQRGQQIADLLASFPHGAELPEVTVSVFSELDAASRCFGGIACYFASSETIVLPDSIGEYQWEQVLAHEYAHHIALNRLNTPWAAYDWGGKYWASATGICTKSRGKVLFDRYRADPGEAFAEAYRLLVASRMPTWTPFPVFVDEELFPMGADALAAVLRDVEQPWTAPRSWSWTRRLRAGQSATLTVRTPLDGQMSVRLVAGRGRLTIGRQSGRRIERLVCGERSSQVRVRANAAGLFRVSVTAP